MTHTNETRAAGQRNQAIFSANGTLLRKTLRRLVGVAIFAVFVALAVLVGATGPRAEPAERQERVWPVTVSRALPTSMSPTLAVYGTLESRQTAQIRSMLSATVLNVEKSEGDWVNKGDLLIQLDPAEAQLAVDLAEASRQRAEADLETVMTEYLLAQELTQHHRELAALSEARLKRYEDLHSRSMIADAQLDDAREQANERAIIVSRHLSSVADYPNRMKQQRAALREAEARLEQARLELRHTSLHAPFSGRVLRTEVAEGDRVTPGNALLHLADYDQLQVRASLSPEVAYRLRPAMDAQTPALALGQLGGREITFRLDRLAGEMKPGQGGIDAFFITVADPSLVVGSIVSLQISLPKEHHVIALPLHAIYDNNRIYRVEDERLQAVQVERVGETTDASGNYRVLVRAHELQAGDSVMTTQLPMAISGLRVNPVEERSMERFESLSRR